MRLLDGAVLVVVSVALTVLVLVVWTVVATAPWETQTNMVPPRAARCEELTAQAAGARTEAGAQIVAAAMRDAGCFR